MKKYILVLIVIIICSCSTSKKVSTELFEKDKSTTKIEQKIEEHKDIISLLTIDTTSNSHLIINITETETTTIDTAGNIKTERNKQTNISNKKEQKGIVQNKIEDKSRNKAKTSLNKKNDTYKELTVTSSTKTKANMNWLYWVIITVIAVIVLYFGRSWIWKMIKKIINMVRTRQVLKNKKK